MKQHFNWYFSSLFLILLFLNQGISATEMKFNDFSDTSRLILNGSATTVTTSDGTVLRLTPAKLEQKGSAFSRIPVDTKAFSTSFKFRITEPGPDFNGERDCNTETGADGIVFVMQAVNSSLGEYGGDLGYTGINSSVGVEFDTWCNRIIPAQNDPNSNHLGIIINGNAKHDEAFTDTVNVTPNFDDGNIWFAWIDYNGNTLEVRANQTGTRPQTPLLARTLNISQVIGGYRDAFIGFTSGTGDSYGNHDIIAWEYRDAVNQVNGEGNVCTVSAPFDYCVDDTQCGQFWSSPPEPSDCSYIPIDRFRASDGNLWHNPLRFEPSGTFSPSDSTQYYDVTQFAPPYQNAMEGFFQIRHACQASWYSGAKDLPWVPANVVGAIEYCVYPENIQEVVNLLQAVANKLACENDLPQCNR